MVNARNFDSDFRLRVLQKEVLHARKADRDKVIVFELIRCPYVAPLFSGHSELGLFHLGSSLKLFFSHTSEFAIGRP